MAYLVSLHNLGCRVNRVELDSIASSLIAKGCKIVAEQKANLIVINTCAVTGEAEAKARKAVRHASNLSQAPLVVATGCVASLFADELKEIGANVYVEPVKANVAARALELLQTHAPEKACGQETKNDDDCSSVAAEKAVTPTGRMRPGLKIQDGCDNRCTYCIVWKARGKATSMPVDMVLAQANQLIADGAKEIVLTGIDLGRYDFEGNNLPALLDTLLSKTSIGRVRISSIEPAGVTPELLRLMATSDGRIAPFLHIPIQSGCTTTLKRMNRPYTADEYMQVIDTVRSYMPDIALACDLIVGFPGETEEEFAESLATCKAAGFANMHVFRYSKRPGTPAATMLEQVPAEVSAKRSRIMRECALEARKAYIASQVNKEQLVLVEGKKLGVTGGLLECLVDEGLEGQLLKLTPSALSREGLLDMRSLH